MANEGQRFEFGKNWNKYLKVVSSANIIAAEDSLKNMLDVQTLEGLTFLDVGSGSGIFSLAARRLGARVYSFDYDDKSVACTLSLKEKYYSQDENWIVHQGSVLDEVFVNSLGKFDVVYSWGVLHHTGDMWNALGNVIRFVDDGGILFIAIYNNQGWRSDLWLKVKQLYNGLPFFLRWMVVIPSLIRLRGPSLARGVLQFKLFSGGQKPQGRGMSVWHDVIDWVGGLPFEVARPDEIFEFYSKHGFRLFKLKTCGGGHGCNEFVFRKDSA